MDADPFAPTGEDSQQAGTVVEEQEGKKDPQKIASLQFKYRNYRYITTIPDTGAAATNSGVRPKKVIKARNWRYDFNLEDPEEKKLYESLLASDQFGVTIFLLKDKKAGDRIVDRAASLRKLNDMSLPQLVNMLTDEERDELGIPVGCSDKMVWIMGIIDRKKLVGDKS